MKADYTIRLQLPNRVIELTQEEARAVYDALSDFCGNGPVEIKGIEYTPHPITSPFAPIGPSTTPMPQPWGVGDPFWKVDLMGGVACSARPANQ